MKTRLLFFLAALLIILATGNCSSETRAAEGNVFQMREQLAPMLQKAWASYKPRFIQNDGRVMDRSNHMISTSEGQSYAMLRAVWSDDQPTFDTVWKWSLANLKRGDRLFAWKWGQRSDGTWGILDSEAASDADQDIAYALILASQRWNKPEYLNEAKAILNDIWTKEVVTVSGRAVLAPSPGAAANRGDIEINPSYFAPYEYRAFAKIDSAHDWNSLVASSYSLLDEASNLSRLDLPPDWCLLKRDTGKLDMDKYSPRSDFSYDAVRIPWRISADDRWYADKRARAYLQKMSFLVDNWRLQRTIRGAYSATGVMRGFDEPLAAFGCCLPMFEIVAPDAGRQLLQEKLIASFYDGLWRPEDDYYGNNWAWFGLALYLDAIPKPTI